MNAMFCGPVLVQFFRDNIICCDYIMSQSDSPAEPFGFLVIALTGHSNLYNV
jgi:hypothetical protein